MKFELHCHSHHSVGTKIVREGLHTPSEIMKAAKKKGLDGVAITDHNSIDAWKEAERAAKKEGLIFIPGMEISSENGHIIGLGLNDFIERDLGADETIEKIHEQGGIAIAVHPYDIKGEGMRDDFVKADAVEVFNALNVDIFANRFTERRVRNVDMPKTVGSDAHNTDMLGYAVNHIDAQDVDSLIREIRHGRIGHEKRYIPIRVITLWVKGRMERSYNYTMTYIKENYWGPKQWLAGYMLNKYVHSNRRKIWNAMGIMSVNISRVYGGLKILSYY